MTFRELYNNLNEKYPIELRCEWDNDGIMCASDLEKEVSRVLLALDVTMDTVNYAVENKFDTIISHHPLVFNSQKSLTTDFFTQRKLIKLIQNGIRVISLHTRLDIAENGVNDTIVSLFDCEAVERDETDPLGRIITLKSKKSLKDFAVDVKNAFSSPMVLYSGKNDVYKVYIVGGDGKDYIQNAINFGADTLLTGRASYNTMIDAEDMGINIIEAGHFYTENPVCKTLESVIKSLIPDATTEIFNSNKIEILK